MSFRKENRILIKLSGGALSDGEEKFSEHILRNTAEKIKALQNAGYELALTVGGGNLFRGKDLIKSLSIARPTADYVGMLATVQNALVLRDYFETQGIVVRVASAISMPQICEPYLPQRAKRHLEKGRVVIFAGGLGNPFFTTDSASVQRALELGCSMLVMAKDGTDAVYTADPNENKDAKKLTETNASFVLEHKLAVADASAISLARDNNLPIKVLSMNNLDKFFDETTGTFIKPE